MALTNKELWDKLQDVSPFIVADFPRTKDGRKGGEPICRYAIRVLKHEETEQAWAAAEAATQREIREAEKSNGNKPVETSGYLELRKMRASREILWRSCFMIDAEEKMTGERLFPTTAHVGQFLTPAETGVMMNSYYRAQHDLGPITAQMTTEEQLGFIKQIAAGGRLDPLDRLSWGMLIDLLRTTVSLIASSTTDTSSPGSPAASQSSSPEE